MAIVKWSMYLCALLFLVIGLGALAVAVVPGGDEWFAEEILDRAGVPDDAFGDRTVSLVADSGGIDLTAWILALTFLPTAALFVWVGRWSASMGSAPSLSAAAVSAMTGGTVVPSGTVAVGGMAGEPSPSPSPAPSPAPAPPTGPVVEPPDPSAGGIIS